MWRKYLIIAIDSLLAVYLVFAITSFNNPDESKKVCRKVEIKIADENTNGFLDIDEIKRLLGKQHMYPLGKPMSTVQPRHIEDLLKTSPFINSAECFKSKDSLVSIEVTQRLPVIRIKSDNGADYYLDDNGGVVPNSHYNSDLIIATGTFSREFAMQSLSLLAQTISSDEFWNAQIEQINVLPNGGIELIPRVGNHIIYIGQLPHAKDKQTMQKKINQYVTHRLHRLEIFYKYGLCKTGWNKYNHINLEFDNQIICKRETTKEEMPQSEETKDDYQDETHNGDNAQVEAEKNKENNPKQI